MLPLLAARAWWLDPVIFSPICCIALFIILAVYLWVRKTLKRRRLIARGGLRAQGTVVDHVSHPLDPAKPNQNLRYRPVIEFSTAAGRTIRHTRETASPLLSPPIGTKVDLLYDPANPADVVVLGDIGS